MIPFPTIAGAVSSSFFRGTAVQSLLDSVEIDGIASPSSGAPAGIVARVDVGIHLNANAIYQGDPVAEGVAYTWYISDSSTGDAVDVLMGQTPTFTPSYVGKFDVTIEVSSLNSFDRQFRRGIVSDEQVTAEEDLDLLIDLAQVQNDTWSNPLANLTYDGGTNANFDFQDVVRAGMVIGLKNNFTGVNFEIIGLRGTEEAPVRIQNMDGQVTFNQTSNGVMFQMSDGCQFVTIDGKCTDDEYGFKFNGRTTAGTQSQLLYMTGAFIKGIRIFGCDFDQKRGLGPTDGGACVQYAGAATAACNYDNFTPAYMERFFNRYQNCMDEGDYENHFDDSIQPSGYRYNKTGDVLFFRNFVYNCGRDGFQITLSTSLEAHDNWIDTVGLEANASHNSIISFNPGNQNSFIYRNAGQNSATFTSAQNGETGAGEYHFYSNRYIQGTFPGSTPNQGMFLNVEDISCNFHVYNMTMKCPDVVIAPVCIQYDNPSTAVSLDFTFAGNAISSGGTNQSFNNFLRTVNTATTDRTGWLADNVAERTADEADLKLDLTTWRPNDATSPIFGGGFDWDARFGAGFVKGGQRDMDGYSLTVNAQLSAGTFSGFELYVA